MNEYELHDKCAWCGEKIITGEKFYPVSTLMDKKMIDKDDIKFLEGMITEVKFYKLKRKILGTLMDFSSNVERNAIMVGFCTCRLECAASLKKAIDTDIDVH